MDSKVLRYFVAVAQSKSYARAARELYMTPQGLQAALKRLEASVGTPLLDAQTGAIELTDCGRIFYRHARSLVREYDVMTGEIEDLLRSKAGHIRLSASTGLFNVIPREAIDEFNAVSKTGAHVELARTLVDYDCENALFDKGCDFALLNDPVDHTMFASVPLHRDTMFLWASEDSDLASRQSVRCKDFEGLTLVCVTPQEFRTSRLVERTICESAQACTVVYADEMIAVLEQSMKMDAYGLTPRTHAEFFKKEGYRGIPVLDLPWGFSIAYRSDRKLGPQDREFIDFMKMHATFYC